MCGEKRPHYTCAIRPGQQQFGCRSRSYRRHGIRPSPLGRPEDQQRNIARSRAIEFDQEHALPDPEPQLAVADVQRLGRPQQQCPALGMAVDPFVGGEIDGTDGRIVVAVPRGARREGLEPGCKVPLAPTIALTRSVRSMNSVGDSVWMRIGTAALMRAGVSRKSRRFGPGSLQRSVSE
jgi:hypothetical protein